MKTSEFIKKMLSESDEVSSKRFLGITSYIIMILVTLIDLFTDLQITEFIYNSLEQICLGGLGLTSLEKMFKNRQKTNDNTE